MSVRLFGSSRIRTRILQGCALAAPIFFVEACSALTSFDGLAGGVADAGLDARDASNATDAENAADTAPLSGDASQTDADAMPDPLAAGLAGYWRFDESAGQTAKDSSGNGNDGTLQGGVTHVAGKVGGALAFDGASGYVHVLSDTSLILTGVISIAFWAQFQGSLNGQPRIIARAGAWDVKMNGPNPQLSSGGPGYAASSAMLTTGAWHHLAFVFDMGNVTIYIDGSMTTLDTDTYKGGDMFNGGTGALFIGAYPGNPPSEFVDALLDEVRIYNRTLSAAEVSALAQ